VSRRSHKMDTEPFRVINRIGKIHGFDFAPIARTRVNFADMERSAEKFLNLLA